MDYYLLCIIGKLVALPIISIIFATLYYLQLMRLLFNFIKLLSIVLLVSSQNVVAQSTATPQMGSGGGTGMNNMPLMNFGRGGTGQGTQTDSLGNIQSNWDDTPAKIYFEKWNSSTKHKIDTSLTYFHRNARIANWGRNLGNEGTPAYDMIFNPRQQIGLHSGYNTWDIYKLHVDSVKFYNTTRPYSDFGYIMGPKKQQYVKLLHTQNITPTWNVAAEVQNLNSPGLYKLQTSRHIIGHISSNYKSENERYKMKAVLLYHRFKQDENGGVQSDSFYSLSQYNDKALIPVLFPGRNYSTVNSGVTNTQKELELLLKHQYALIGVYDTTYNDDSTSVSIDFTPRFTIHHTLSLKNQQNIFNDVAPETQRYYDFSGQIINFNTVDSVYTNQRWMSIQNRFGISGTLGKLKNQVKLEAGIGNSIDRFKSAFPADSNNYRNVYLTNYVYGELLKEAYEPNQWQYGAQAQFNFTGPSVGNFFVDAYLGKVVKDIAMLQLGFRQSLSETGHFINRYATNFYQFENDLTSTSTTSLWAQLGIPKWKMNLTGRNLLMGNYVYLNDQFKWQQHNEVFNVFQLAANKDFNYGIFYNENEVIYQQLVGDAPVNFPSFMLRHQLRIETPVFNKNLHFSFGVEGRYHTPYGANGYMPYYNQFYYQNIYQLKNKPELMAFFNFKVRAFRAFVVLDQVQTLWWQSNIYAPGYGGTNMVFRFGFNWVLYN